MLFSCTKKIFLCPCVENQINLEQANLQLLTQLHY